ncbi:predicted protein [Sclerotinia sclerotiorum 1980 UF-70]|uniref:Uncharacterized protein n=1 Tax=Sclerotinia sclerotiorum (strain ATCC 18683 / 1980 / Ss-1) TaxID=665079 RepID=A7F6P9_SCLS1|nr:predicted protein [Sclerotinia sclerotiorum 1980 UF-70]EDN98420.1 predicted protein [Sclerotinia sclerotiorum 1980 UF-70]
MGFSIGYYEAGFSERVGLLDRFFVFCFIKSPDLMTSRLMA